MSDMSNEVAVRLLQTARDKAESAGLREAIDRGIKALEQEPTTKKDLAVEAEDLANYKDANGNSLDDLILEVLQDNFDCGNTYGYKVADAIIELLPTVYPKSDKPSDDYKRGWTDAITLALKETHNYYTEDGVFKAIQEETLIGVGMMVEEQGENTDG